MDTTTPPDATATPSSAPTSGKPPRRHWKWVTVLVLLLLAGVAGEVWFKAQRAELYRQWEKTHQVEPLVLLINKCVTRENWRMIPRTPDVAEKACITHLLAIQDAMGRADVTGRLRELGYWTPDLGEHRPQAVSPVPAWEDGLPDELSARNPSARGDGSVDVPSIADTAPSQPDANGPAPASSR